MERVLGSEILFYIKHEGVWYPVSCLTSSPLSESSETIQTTTRDNQGWKTSFPTLQSYSISLSGVVVFDDEDNYPNILSYRQLRAKKRNRELIEWKQETANGYFIDEGKGHIINISHDDPIEEECTFQAQIEGFGMPIERSARIYTLGNNEREPYVANYNELIPVK